MTDKPNPVELENAQYRLKLTNSAHEQASALYDTITLIEELGADPDTADAHGVLLAVLSTTSAALGRGVLNASRDLGYLTGELQRPEPDTYTRHRDAITGQYIDADEAAARPETTVRETRKP